MKENPATKPERCATCGEDPHWHNKELHGKRDVYSPAEREIVTRELTALRRESKYSIESLIAQRITELMTEQRLATTTTEREQVLVAALKQLEADARELMESSSVGMNPAYVLGRAQSALYEGVDR